MNDATMIPGADEAAIARALEERLDKAALGAGRIAIAMPGGQSPFPIMKRLAGLDCPWQRVDIWPTDDRMVPEDHPASNAGRIRNLFAPRGARVCGLAQGQVLPHFAFAWVGMGLDGHVASLFPSADPRADAPSTVIRVDPDPLPVDAPWPRLSMTIPALLNAGELVFVLKDMDKLALFQAARSGDTDVPIARLLRAARLPVTCFT